MGAGRLIQRPAHGYEPGSPAWKAGILPPRQLAPQEAGGTLVVCAVETSHAEKTLVSRLVRRYVGEISYAGDGTSLR